LGLLGAGALYLVGCARTPDDQRAVDLNATATAASGKQITSEQLGKYGSEAIRTLAQAVGIISVAGPNISGHEGDSGTAWYVQLPEQMKGARVVTAAHVLFNRDTGADPATASLISFGQPINPAATILEFEGPIPGQVALPEAYRRSDRAGKVDIRDDVGVFTVDDFNAPPAALRFDPNYQPRQGEQLLALGYPHELIGQYPDTSDIDPSKTVMYAALATVVSYDNGVLSVNCEVDTGASGGPVIAERDGQYFAVGVLSARDAIDAQRAYVAPLSDLPALLQ
jgi:hypothetical protein